MNDYLNYQFEDNQAFINTFDEAPLWSASFGLLLLKHLDLKPNMTVLDLGCGAGFPLLELAGRLGSSCKLYGIDPWTNATQRAKQKISNYGYYNVHVIENDAAQLPFGENTIDLIVSNLGINNFENPAVVFKEANRVLKPNASLVLTTNLNGHWAAFYQLFYETLLQIGKERLISVLKADEEHRGTIDSVSKLYTDSGFQVTRVYEDTLDMRFVDGSAFLNHHFVKLGWLTTWMSLFPKEELPEIFTALEHNLNNYAAKNKGLTLKVPMAFFEGVKLP